MTWLAVRAHNLYSNFRNREEGQTMAEYALILGLIAVFVILMIFFLGGEIKDLFRRTGSSVNAAPNGLGS